MGAIRRRRSRRPGIEAQILERIIRPTVEGMAAEGRPFRACFAGVMATKDGPKLIEFNCRFGDPECEVICLRMMSDIVPALMASRDGALKVLICAGIRIRAHRRHGGEGLSGEAGDRRPIRNLDAAAKLDRT